MRQTLRSAAQSLGIRVVVRGHGSLGGGRHEGGADLQIDAHVLAGVDALLEVVPPRLDQRSTQPPTSYCVATDSVQRERRAPAVVAERLHLRSRASPVRCRGNRHAPAEHDANFVVTVGEHVRLDDEHVADYPLDRESPAVDLRR